MGANAGVVIAVTMLKRLKKKYPLVSWADTIQMASACAIEHAGGPHRPIGQTLQGLFFGWVVGCPLANNLASPQRQSGKFEKIIIDIQVLSN